MHFKLDRIAFILFIITFLVVGCKKDYEGTFYIQRSIKTVDELNQLVMGINFQVTLSNGMTIEFTPNQLLTNMEGNSFTNTQGINYTNSITILSGEFGDGNASLDISVENFKFPLLFCTTVKELMSKYPLLYFSPDMREYVVYFAAGNSKYTERDVVFGIPHQVDHLLRVVANPNDLNIEGTFITSYGTYYGLNGDYKNDGELIESSGYTFNNDIYGDYQSKRYTLLMRCSN